MRMSAPQRIGHVLQPYGFSLKTSMLGLSRLLHPGTESVPEVAQLSAGQRGPFLNEAACRMEIGLPRGFEPRGWDECFPSVSECRYPSAPWQGAAIQDHGELWSQAAVVEIIEKADSISLQTQWQGVALPYTFSRVVTLPSNSSTLRVEYAAANNSDQPLAFVWCIHALLAIVRSLVQATSAP